MRTRALCLLWFLLLTGIAMRSETLEEAAKSFREGHFEEADKAAAAILSSQQNNHDALLIRGRVALLENRPADAEKWLASAKAISSEDQSVHQLLEEIYYRQGEFTKAAAEYRLMGREAPARQLESFLGRIPYEIRWSKQLARVKFIETDPLPLITATVDGKETGNFLIDTGGSEVIVDTDFAKRAGVATTGEESRMFGGGKKAPVQFAGVNSVRLGDVEIENVPVQIMNTKPFSVAANGKAVDGVIGTVLLSHFLATIDYPAGELVLRPREAEPIRDENTVAMPFWMAGDHFLVVWATVNDRAKVLLLVDTGAAGLGFIPANSLVSEAGIAIANHESHEAAGGGGTMSVTPFQLASLTLGSVRRGPLNSAFGPFPEPLENSQGFRIAGIVSHEFFRAYALTLDFARMRLLLQPGPQTAEPEPAVEERMSAMAGKIMAAVNSDDYEALEQDFGQTMRAVLPVDKLKQAMDGLTAKMGHIERLGKGKQTGANQAVFPAYFEHGEQDLTIYLDDQNHLAGMGFQPPPGNASADEAPPVPPNPNLVGKAAPEFHSTAMDGKAVDLSALRGKGRGIGLLGVMVRAVPARIAGD